MRVGGPTAPDVPLCACVSGSGVWFPMLRPRVLCSCLLCAFVSGQNRSGLGESGHTHSERRPMVCPYSLSRLSALSCAFDIWFGSLCALTQTFATDAPTTPPAGSRKAAASLHTCPQPSRHGDAMWMCRMTCPEGADGPDRAMGWLRVGVGWWWWWWGAAAAAGPRHDLLHRRGRVHL